MIHMTAITHHRFIIDRLREAIDKFDCYLSVRDLSRIGRKTYLIQQSWSDLRHSETWNMRHETWDMTRNEHQGAKSSPRKCHNTAVTMNIKQTTIPVSKYHPSTKVVSFHVEQKEKKKRKEKKKKRILSNWMIFFSLLPLWRKKIKK